MSLRYVWEKWNTKEVPNKSANTTTATITVSSHPIYDEPTPIFFFGLANNHGVDGGAGINEGTFLKLANYYLNDHAGGAGTGTGFLTYKPYSRRVSASEGNRWNWAGFVDENNEVSRTYGPPPRKWKKIFSYAGLRVLSYSGGTNIGDTGTITFSCDYAYERGLGKGSTSYGNVSSNSESAYPANSYSGSYWYVRKGSDTIDPTTVEYPAPHGGNIVSVNIRPSVGNTYGGTIYYRVEYKLNDGAWQVAQTSTTSTTVPISVPSGTQTFTARVLASDNMGFTSSDYVVGVTQTVTNNDGARYVWNKYNTTQGYVQISEQITTDSSAATNANSIWFNTYDSSLTYNKAQQTLSQSSATMTVYRGTGYTFNPEHGTYNLTGGASVGSITKGGTIDVSPDYYYAIVYTGTSAEYGTIFRPVASGTITITQPSTGSGTRCYPTCTQNVNLMTSVNGTSQGGTDYGPVSSGEAGAYPVNGVSGNYYYVYLGVDCIDPSNVVYETAQIMTGQPLTVSVTPSDEKVYGGNTLYNWEYQTNVESNSWTTIETTSNPTVTFNVPDNDSITTISVRVHCSDDIGFTSSVNVSGTSQSVTSNEPPTKPATISATNVMTGKTITVTWGESTDPDGSVVEYSLEHSIDGNAFTVVATVQASNERTYSEHCDEDWATITYRVRAKDNEGAYSAYNTTQVYTVQSGMLYISDDYETPMGAQDKPFNFTFKLGWTGEVDDLVYLSYSIKLDNTPWTTDETLAIADASDNRITVDDEAIDTRAFATGEHTIYLEVHGLDTNSDPLDDTLYPVSKSYTFTISEVKLANGGYLTQLEDNNVQPVFPITLASGVFMDDGKSLADTIEGFHDVAHYLAGTYVGTGTNTVSLTFPMAPKLVYIAQQNSGAYYAILRDGVTGFLKSPVQVINVSFSGKTVSWEGEASANEGLNTSGTTYSYFAIC